MVSSLRKNIIGDKLFVLAGIKTANYTLKTDIKDFGFPKNNYSLKGDPISYYNSAQGDLSTQSFQAPSFVLFKDGAGDIEEAISGFVISPELGFSYRLLKTLSNRIYIDVMWSPAFKNAWRNGNLDFLNNVILGYQFPLDASATDLDPNFPYENDFEENSPMDSQEEKFWLTVSEEMAYQFEDSEIDIDNVTNTATNFSVGSLSFGGTLQFDIATNWGISTGITSQIYLTELFKSSQSAEEDFLSSHYFSNLTADEKFVLTRYYTDVKPLLVHFKLGVYYEFGN